MRIAILGTRGIPNRYGGFEQFAEILSRKLADLGHMIYVTEPFAESEDPILFARGVFRVRIGVPRRLIPAILRTLLYDLYSLIWARRQRIDCILECGHSFSPWLWFFDSSFRKKVIVNPDGLEHKRSKWGIMGRLFLLFTERQAVKLAAALVCDNRALVSYYRSKYGINPVVIPYGADVTIAFSDLDVLRHYSIFPPYSLVISRFTPENSLELILSAFADSGKPIVVVGGGGDRYSLSVVGRYASYKNIRFLGPIYNRKDLDSLRHNALLYIHGHTVGGTNPSLLEAMAAGAIVAAHRNPFNYEVLGRYAFYFSTKNELLDIVRYVESMKPRSLNLFTDSAISRIRNFYSWDWVARKYETVFFRILNRKSI